MTNEGTAPIEVAAIEPSPIVAPEPFTTPAKNTKLKTTPNLQSILNPTTEKKSVEKVAEIIEPIVNRPVRLERLKEIWNEFAEQRKDQAAEYQILKREIHFEHPVISVQLTNPVEETLLENFRLDFVKFLRDRLQNTELNLLVSVQKASGKKVLYTSKEKFEHMAEKNPCLNDLKDKLGLDWDY